MHAFYGQVIIESTFLWNIPNVVSIMSRIDDVSVVFYVVDHNQHTYM